MASSPVPSQTSAAVVTTNVDEDCSPAALSTFLDELFAGTEPDVDSVGGARAVRELRDNATT